MTAYKYQMGTWEEIDDPIVRKAEYGDDIEQIIAEMGFLPEIYIGKKGRHFSVEVYAHKHGGGPEGYGYIVYMNTNVSSLDIVYIPDLPSYLMFMREMAPLVILNPAIEEEK